MIHKNKMMIIAVVLFAVLCCTTGCDTEGTVIDQAKIETVITNASFCGEKFLRIASGGGEKQVPIEAISRIFVSNETYQTINGRLYFCATVEFADGKKLDARDKSNNPLTFIDVSTSICGESQKGHFTISLADVYKAMLVTK
jgi:hypothetical protein